MPFRATRSSIRKAGEPQASRVPATLRESVVGLRRLCQGDREGILSRPVLARTLEERVSICN
jgi:hypothetical protein